MMMMVMMMMIIIIIIIIIINCNWVVTRWQWLFYMQNMKLVTTIFKSGGIHEKPSIGHFNVNQSRRTSGQLTAAVLKTQPAPFSWWSGGRLGQWRMWASVCARTGGQNNGSGVFLFSHSTVYQLSCLAYRLLRALFLHREMCYWSGKYFLGCDISTCIFYETGL